MEFFKTGGFQVAPFNRFFTAPIAIYQVHLPYFGRKLSKNRE